MKQLYALLTLGLLPICATALEPINESNWINHPEVKEIRAIYKQVNDLQAAGKLKKQTQHCNLYGGEVSMDGALYKDANGQVRKYSVSAGSGDSTGAAEYYYDEFGYSRFTYRTGGATNGTKREERIYFNAQGEHLYTNTKEQGPGYPFGGIEDSVANPVQNFKDLCKE